MSGTERLLEIMARLRDPDGGCPWDLEQRFETIAPYTLEEAYEVDDAIRQGDMAALRDELGDLLLQVVFHARMAEEAGHFDYQGVVEAICDKMVRRHPHVFGDVEIEGARAENDAWETHKAAERVAKGGASAMDGVALALPALSRAAKLVRRALRAELGALVPEADGAAPTEAALAEELFRAAARAARHGLDPEEVLRAEAARFEARVRAAEAGSEEPGT